MVSEYHRDAVDHMVRLAFALRAGATCSEAEADALLRTACDLSRAAAVALYRARTAEPALTLVVSQ